MTLDHPGRSVRPARARRTDSLAPPDATAPATTTRATTTRATTAAGTHGVLVAVAWALPVLAVVSLFVGVGDVRPGALLALDPDAWQLVAVSRLPRTLAVVLSGGAMAVAGTIMQMIVRNRFAEPSTTGTVEFAVLGLLVVTLVAPGLPMAGRLVVATLFALAGTALFLVILQRVPLRSPLVVPLVGIVLGGVVAAVATFIAYRTDLLQALAAWSTGDFSGILRGRYEMLWVAAALAVVAYVVADRFTVAGLGEAFSTNLGLDHRRTVTLGLVVVSVVSAVVVVTVGIVPFLGLVVPNVVSLLRGDDVRRALPWVAALGAGLVLVCDLVGRLVRFPYEVPVGVVVGVVGSALFLWLLLRADSGSGRVG